MEESEIREMVAEALSVASSNRERGRDKMSNFTPSKYQQAIFDFITQGQGNGVVNAVAGSGKTTTLVEAAKLIKTDAVFVAFNKHIVTELEGRLRGTRMVAQTMHSIGLRCVSTHLATRPQIDDRKYSTLVKEWMGQTQMVAPEDRADTSDRLHNLVNFCRQTLTSPRDPQAMAEMCAHHDITLEGWEPEVVATLLSQGDTLAKAGIIDFTDMIYLPYRWNLRPTQVRWVFVDEAQDLNRAQQDLVLKLVAPGGRILAVGDPRQAIYGFAGADAKSFDRLATLTQATSLPLSICYRCPSSHVDLARQIVPEIEAAPNAQAGVVGDVWVAELDKHIKAGDLVICRLTAPLIGMCLDLIANGVHARVKGRHIGATLGKVIKQVEKVKGYSWAKFGEYLSKWAQMQARNLSQMEGSEAKAEALWDQVEAIKVVYTSTSPRSAEELVQAIQDLFSDNHPAVTLSTVHRAKGLENGRVFILRPDKLPLQWKNQQAWELEQEYNLKYVALTRAKAELYWIQEQPITAQAPAPAQAPIPLAPIPAVPQARTPWLIAAGVTLY